MTRQLAATRRPSNKDSAFIVGLFSTLDALMDQPLPEILGTLPLDPDITAALRRRQGPCAAIRKTIGDVYLHSLARADATMRDIRAD